MGNNQEPGFLSCRAAAAPIPHGLLRIFNPPAPRPSPTFCSVYLSRRGGGSVSINTYFQYHRLGSSPFQDVVCTPTHLWVRTPLSPSPSIHSPTVTACPGGFSFILNIKYLGTIILKAWRFITSVQGFAFQKVFVYEDAGILMF